MARKSKSPAAPPKPVSRVAIAVRCLLVLVAAVLLAAGIGRGGTWFTIQRLTSRIRTADDAQAARLVRELALLEGPAYDELVAAAASPRSSVALAARAEIDRRLDDWQQQVYLHPATFSLSNFAIPLAAAIDQHHVHFTSSSRRWARRVLRNLLSLSAQQPAGDRLALVRTCDRALTAMPAEQSVPLPEADVDYRVTLAPPVVENRFAEASDLPRDPPTAVAVAKPEPLSMRFAQVSPQPFDSQPSSPTATQPQPQSDASAPPSDWNPAWSARPQAEPPQPGQPAPGNVSIKSSRVPAHSASTTRLAPPPTSLDANQAEVEIKAATSVASREEAILFRMLATGDSSGSSDSSAAEQQTYAAEQLLVRGFGHVTPRDARMAISPSTNDRMAMVDLVLTSSRLESRKWLWRLAHDASGEVRAAALSSIATSSDRDLIEAALQLALRDTDPRVAEQASLLRQSRR